MNVFPCFQIPRTLLVAVAEVVRVSLVEESELVSDRCHDLEIRPSLVCNLTCLDIHRYLNELALLASVCDSATFFTITSFAYLWFKSSHQR